MDSQVEDSENSGFGEYKHYVYALIDASGSLEKIFYVGKGVKDRLDSHEEESNKELDSNHPKLIRIRELKAKEQDGGFPQGTYFKARIIGRYKTNDEALAVEATLIKFCIGRDNLANKIHGARHFMVRASGSWEVITGIDNIRNVTAHLRDGEYSERQRQQIIENNIFEKLEMLKEEIRAGILDVTVSEPDLDIAQDPTLWVNWTGAKLQISLKLQLTGRSVVVGVRPLSRADVDVENFKSRLKLMDERRPSVEREAYPWQPRGDGGAQPFGWYCLTRDFKTKDCAGLQSYPRGFPLEEVNLILSEIRKVKGLYQSN